MTDDEIKELNFSGWPLPDAYLIEIGRLTALWASLESALNLWLGKLAGFNELNDPKPFILFAHSSFPQRLDNLGALCEHLVDKHPQLKAYKEVISKLKHAQSLRNRFAHNGMWFDEKEGKAEMAVGSARGSLKMNVSMVDIADIRRATMTVDEANMALHGLITGRPMDPAWRRKNPSQ